MPHSVTPESTQASESSATMAEATIKSENTTEDVAMDDAPSPAQAEDKSKVNLEDLFDDDDDDEEFASSAPVKSEPETLQPAATLYAFPSGLPRHCAN